MVDSDERGQRSTSLLNYALKIFCLLIDCSMFDEIQRRQLINNSTFVLHGPLMGLRQKACGCDVTGFGVKNLFHYIKHHCATSSTDRFSYM